MHVSSLEMTEQVAEFENIFPHHWGLLNLLCAQLGHMRVERKSIIVSLHVLSLGTINKAKPLGLDRPASSQSLQCSTSSVDFNFEKGLNELLLILLPSVSKEDRIRE